MANVNNWFEIPVSNIERAFKFYSEMLGGELNQMEMIGTKMAIFQIDWKGVGGSLCRDYSYKPTTDGAKIYLNGGEDLSVPLSKVEKAGERLSCRKQKLMMKLVL